MRRLMEYLALAAVCFLLTSCGEKEKIGGGYVLETPQALNPDAHPGTSLRRKGKVIWDNVYVGYFGPNDASKFYQMGYLFSLGHSLEKRIGGRIRSCSPFVEKTPLLFSLSVCWDSAWLFQIRVR
jgi:hypothetical protein